MFGFINTSKPSGKTSRQVVDRVVRCAGGGKAGHAGTLDPLASGVLVVAVGPATRLIHYVQQMPKRYEAIFLLGRDSPTEDIEGPVVELADGVIPSRDALAAGGRRIDRRHPATAAGLFGPEGGRPTGIYPGAAGRARRAGAAAGDDSST